MSDHGNDGRHLDRATVEAAYRAIQDRFCQSVEEVDGEGAFDTDIWERPGGGGGITRILAGSHIEKAAVNFSAVSGPTPPRLSDRLATESGDFYASGISIIVHPRNPHAPTFHANLRYFETDSGVAWLGGGADLTPYYLYEEDARHFHGVLRQVCEAHDLADYQSWKTACDEYFYLPHRNEARGVGGLFFDHLIEPLEETWEFQAELGERLTDAYLPILRRRIDTPHGEDEIAWQEIRRGRYAEFNLVWDRGTRFGLETAGRVESILASLPPRVRWVYGHEPEPGTPEAELVQTLRNEPRDWA